MDKKPPLKIVDFTEEELKQIRRMLSQTFDYIAPDLLACQESRDPSIPRDEAIEVTLDADYLESYGGKKDRPLVERFRRLSYDDQIAVAKPAFPYRTYGY